MASAGLARHTSTCDQHTTLFLPKHTICRTSFLVTEERPHRLRAHSTVLADSRTALRHKSMPTTQIRSQRHEDMRVWLSAELRDG